MADGHPELERLLDVVARFRGETGCAWFEAQTHDSLVPYLVEESAELVDAIEDGAPEDVREELGDVLFQVLFHASVAGQRDDGTGFDLEDVARDQADKLVRRNPHVFGERPTRDMDEIIAMWRDAKAVEKARRTSVLDGVPHSLPALARASKLLGRAADVGIEPRAAEVVGDASPERRRAAEDALGERLLDEVREARAAGLDPERALRGALGALEARIRAAEAPVASSADATDAKPRHRSAR
ncbi:MazG family protein [Pseudoclavibacter chungangensis]|uniref:MazG family protein n=1 Tax=Pseudoclavibacter chungangensis TaxID=587635 RepID=A0A7J5BUB2_9MICO|nr:MazG family protein [Pseudoclavibacter chungangensis]KAB1657947.1 MazG family protein [Pseudoclavibacter chungangensis]NYJ65900.1 XTP/dITP diphosphohydrolase [Pseudoclavibacter chungangensis]